MEPDEVPYQCQSDAKAAARPLERSIPLHEHVEDLWPHLGSDADAIVADPDAQLVLVVVRLAHGLRDEPDVSARGRELDGVVEQVHQHLRQPDRIGVQQDRLVRQ